ncbi:MAG TPA: MBL fold metallo-hydrolase [Marmoricola sp.]|jgi:L-ascorbate metabolism protein UlaG (beta-lactamase superfamily)|nr:MBL fold metallo-hydrolase [Marmoricola sp.]
MPSLEFVGTATTLLRLGPFTLLTDPNFLHRGQRAYLGKGLFSKRLTEPSLQPADLPSYDAVLLSHLHGDHFDRIARRELDRQPPVITTPEAADRLRSWGFSQAQGMQTWESTTFSSGQSSLRITSTPGQHAPGLAQPLLPPVMGSVLELQQPGEPSFRVYVTGDTLYRDWLREVTERHGRLDAMVIHLGGTRAFGILVTMDADQGGDLVQLLEPAVTVPVHHDDYTVFRSPLSDFRAAWQRRGLPGELRVVHRGETIPLH